MVKYIALILTFVATIISTFFPLSGSKKNTKWKIMFALVAILGFIFTFFQTWEDGKNSNQEKVTLQKSKTQDSLRLVKLIKQSDTTVDKLEKYEKRFEEIVKKADLTVSKLNETVFEVRNQAQNILKSSSEANEKLLAENSKIKFPIPNEIHVKLDFEFKLSQEDSVECFNLINSISDKRLYGIFKSPDETFIFNPQKYFRESTNPIFLILNKLNKGKVSRFRINFKDKSDNVILHLSDNTYSLEVVRYSLEKKKFYMTLSLPVLKPIKSKVARSLIDIEGSNIQVYIGPIRTTLEQQPNYVLDKLGIKLNHISLQADGVTLSINDFVRNNDSWNFIFEKQLSKEEIWK